MASLAETLGARGIQQNPVAKDIQTGVNTGIQLATMQDQIEQEKIKTDQMKEQLDTAKFNKAVGSLQTLARANPQIAKKLVPRIQQSLSAAGIAVDPLVLENMASDDEWKRRINASSDLFSGIAKNPAAIQESLSALNDFGMFDQGLQELSSQNKLRVQEEMADKRLQTQIRATEKRADKDESKAISEAKKAFDSAIKDDMDALTQATKAEALLAAGGTISSEAAKSTVARMFEKGVLTDADISRLAGGRSVYDRGAQLAETLTTGKLTPENQRELLRIVKEIRPVLTEKVNARAAREAQAQASIWPNIPQERFVEAYNVGSLLNAVNQEDPRIKKFRESAKASGKSDEEIEAFIKQKMAGG